MKKNSSPPGKNYITPNGFKKLQDELRDLLYKQRPEVTEVVSWAASNGDRSENGDYLYGKKKLREIDRRIQFLTQRIDQSEIIDPLTVKSEQVQFGATVELRDEDDNEKTYVIVGSDEVDLTKGRISWVSPLGGALLKSKAGDVVTFTSPKGQQEVEVLTVRYEVVE